jgi:flagellar M-ring protein FliF
VVNYEISRTTRTEVVEGGRLKRLSVAVLLDGLYSRGSNGEVAYQPRPQEELDRIAALVRTAIGFDRNRGDQIEVVNLRFAEAPSAVEVADEPLLSSLFNPSKEDLFRLMELGVIAVLTLIVILTVVRPMLRNALGVSARSRGGATGGASADAEPSIPMPNLPQTNAAAQMIEIAKISGQMRADSVDRIGDMVKGNPQETVAVLRNWIHDR